MKHKYPVIFVLLVGLLFAWCPDARGEDAPSPVVRVGFFAFSGYHEMEDDGRLDGYGYEFLQKLAAYGDWTYQYLGYDSSYADSLDMLREGKVDVVTSVSKTPEREEEFLFSKKSIGTNSTMFTVKAGNSSVISGDYSTYEGLRIGMLEGNSKNQNFETFAADHGFSYIPVYYETEDQLTSALQEGSLDGIVTGSLRATRNEWIIESFAASNFYIVTGRDRPDLMEQINHAIDQMDLQEPDWRTSLHSKYYATDSGGFVMLTAEERQKLEELAASPEPVKVLFNPDRAPYSYFEDGKASGIIPAVFETLAGRLSLACEYIPVSTREEYYRLRKSRQADIILDFSSDYYLAEQEGYKITRPYLNVSFVRITRDGFRGGIRTVASVYPSDILNTYIQRQYAGDDILYYGTIDECVQAVVRGEADSTVLYAYMAEQVLQRDIKNQLSFVLLDDSSLSYSIGVNAEDGHVLLSVFNKALSSLSSAELSNIVSQETASGKMSPAQTVIAFIYSNPVFGFLAVFSVCLFVFLCVLLYLRSRNQRNLQKRVAEVSGQYEAQKKELSDALALADQANRAKTTFLNNMSHDIRTPMNAIIGYTALAASHLDNEERTRDYLAKIAQSSNHLLSLINDVLDMSRIESGHVNVENKPENLADILHSLRNIIQADVHAKRLELFIDTIDVTNESISCDKLRLNQILLNLLSNSIKFTRPGGTVALRVTQKPCPRAGYGTYEFKVKDTGIGMSPEFAKTIFEPFTRERTSTVSGIQGTGLGMAITKNIVNMMHGTIQVESEQRVGTEFTVVLEFELCGDNTALAPIVELKDLRSLVVDDDLVSCQSVSKMLRQIGMRAEWTRYGKEAVIRASEAHEMADPYEVYIVDWSMPDLNGVETVRQIRQVVGQEAPIILLSAYDLSEIEDEARAAGVTDFISKPLFLSDLHRILERALGKIQDTVEETSARDNSDFIGKRILLVEDNELNREIATELLSEVGFKVECAEDGQIACRMVEQSSPGYYSVILMDVQMPVMNGYDATRIIRGLDDPALANIPIIAMTANAFEEDRQRALEAGMNGHLAKPVDADKMIALLDRILKP